MHEELIINSTNLFLHTIKDLGVKEIPGPEGNEKIVKWTQRLFPWAQDDTVPWCSILIYNKAIELGLEVPKKNPGLARSWLDVGVSIPLEEAVPGDLCIYWRVSPDSVYGHIHEYVNITDAKKFIRGLGGNQGNELNIRPYAVSRLLDVRRLRKAQADDQA